MFTPDAAGYEQWRIMRHANALRCSYHLGRQTEPTISAYWSGELKLPAPRPDEMADDRDALMAQGRGIRAEAIDAAHKSRARRAELRSRIRVERFLNNDTAAFEANLAAIAENVTGRRAYGRELRALSRYVGGLLAAVALAQAAE